MAKYADKYFIASPWHVTENGFSEQQNRAAESVFALANEYMGVRGYFDEGTCADSLQGSYFNGIYEMDYDVPKSYKGIVSKAHFMVNAANWLATSIEVDGEKLCIGKSRIENFVRELSMRDGTLERSFVWQTASEKRLKLRFLRFVSMCESTAAYQCIELTPLNFSGAVTVECGIDFNVTHEVKQRCYWTQKVNQFENDNAGIVGQTLYSGQRVFAGFCVQCSEAVSEQPVIKESYIGKRMTVSLRQNAVSRIDKLITCIADPKAKETAQDLFSKGMGLLCQQKSLGLDAALENHKDFWHTHWEHADVQIAGKHQEENQQGIRFAIFQLTQTFHSGSDGHNIGAKGLTGEFYNGHAFWDSECYCLSYYLFADPSAARSLLEFRYNTLDKAKERAKMLDCEGACYPVATLNGEEACTLWQHANLQFQTNTAIAYAIRHYVNVTGDTDFVYKYGVRILVEICRYLDSRGAYGQKTKQFGFYGVMGPDEFHMMVSNDCYTNYMSKMTYQYTMDVIHAMEGHPQEYEQLKNDTGITEEELSRWHQHEKDMRIPQDAKSGLFEQHDGFFDMPHIDINKIPAEEFPLYHKWSYDRIYRRDMIKQPAVLMMLFLYNSCFDMPTKRVNYEYYEPRTIHESSLSPSVHSVLACELGKLDDAMRLFEYATRLDLDNFNRNTHEGLHTTSLAAAWINIVYGFGGMRSDGEVIRLAPVLPPGWDSYSFKINIRGSLLSVCVDDNGTALKVECGTPVMLDVYGKSLVVGKDQSRVPIPKFKLEADAL